MSDPCGISPCRLAAGEHEVALRRDAVHDADALADGLQRKALGVLIFLLVDAEGAVVVAVIGDEDRHRGAALSGFVRIAHLPLLFYVK